MTNNEQSKCEEELQNLSARNYQYVRDILIKFKYEDLGDKEAMFCITEKYEQTVSDLLKERDIEIINKEEDIAILEEELAERDKQWLSCLPEDSPNYAKLCQNQNGLEYCGNCEQAWEYCSCSARNTGHNKCKKDFLQNAKSKGLIN